MPPEAIPGTDCAAFALRNKKPPDRYGESHATGILDRPGVYQSRLTGRSNITLKWAPDETQFTQMNLSPAPPPGADLLQDFVTAFQEQLGMKLESTKAPVDAIVIDQVSRPSEN
jgi:uncharacterized protein (TIGR03435 family)